MKFELEALPYSEDALAPHISARTLHFHYGKHHQGYMDKLEKAIGDKPEAEKSLEEVIRGAEWSIYNFAAQVWNHDFYWKSMKPGGGGAPSGDLRQRIQADFGSVEDFKQRFAEVAKGEFGSGWAWLALHDGRLRVLSTTDAENLLDRPQLPLLACDVWEHAYYLDYQNERARYVEAFLDHLIDWDFATENLKRATRG